MHKTCTAALTNTGSSVPQSQNMSDLSCIPWSPLKSVPGTTDMWIPCACACALLWDFPKPTLTQRLRKGLQRWQCCPCEPAFSAAQLHAGSCVTGSQDLRVREGVSCFERHPLGKPNMWKGVQRVVSGPFPVPKNTPVIPAAAMLQVHKGNRPWSWFSLFHRQE